MKIKFVLGNFFLKMLNKYETAIKSRDKILQCLQKKTYKKMKSKNNTLTSFILFFC